uniref:Uncharacterized protein n=1 Tax=Caenorhabditis japonica TaxID=281687 RepID=A0A8R1IRB6_CAEJA
MDINDPYVLMVDMYLERVILQQGEVVLDAARRLSRPHMHLTSMINKILQMMREKGIEPILPGTLEERVPQEDESVVVRSGVQVTIDNIIRDTSMAVKHIEQLNKLIETSDRSRNEYVEHIRKNPMGELVQELVNECAQKKTLKFDKRHIVESSMEIFSTLAMLGPVSDEGRTTTPTDTNRFDENIVATPVSRGDATITRARGNMIRPKRTTMNREQLENIKLQLSRAKQQT